MVGSPYRTPSRELSSEEQSFPLTPRSSTDSLASRKSTPTREAQQPPSQPSKLIRLDSQDSYEEDDPESDQFQRPRLTLYDASWSEEPANGLEDDLDSTDRRRERRRRNRRIYGGGRHRHADGDADEEQDDEDDGGGGNEDMTVGEVAGLITAGT